MERLNTYRARDLAPHAGSIGTDASELLAGDLSLDDAEAIALAAACIRLGLHSEGLRIAAGRTGTSDDPAIAADAALCMLAAGENKHAQTLLQYAVSHSDAPAEAFARLGVVELNLGDLPAAQGAFERAVALSGGWPELESNLAGVYVRQGKHERAIELYDRVLAMKPDLVAPQHMRRLSLEALGRGDDLVEELSEAIEHDPENPELWMQLGMAQRGIDDWDGARATLSTAVDQFPGRIDIVELYLDLLRGRRESMVMVRELTRLVESDSWSAHRDRLVMDRIQAYIDARALDDAEKELESLADEQKEIPNYYHSRARLLIERLETHEAVELLEEAIEKFPGFEPLTALIEHALTSLGRTEEAATYLDQDARSYNAVSRRIEVANYKASAEDIEDLKRHLGNPRLQTDGRIRGNFTLAKALEKAKDYDGAFQAVTLANDLKKGRLSYDWRTHRMTVDGLIRVTTREWFEQNPASSGASQSVRPIFVVGMPRSGTTLTEQILASHPLCHGAGELPWINAIVCGEMLRRRKFERKYPICLADIEDEDVAFVAKRYLDELTKIDDQKSHVVDKLPHNFMHVGMMALAFPNAKIIHLDRDRRDIAVSNYFQDYQAFSGTMGFCYDLEDIGHMLNDHDRVMAHWKEMLGERIYTFEYDNMVADPEPYVAALLEYCGLPWDDRVMEFSSLDRAVRTASVHQVREGIYKSSSAKWRRYEGHLAPLDAILEQGYRSMSEISFQEMLSRKVPA